MSNPNKRRGTNWEVDVENYLHGAGFPDALRQVQRGIHDVGDVHVWRLALQCKDDKAHDLSGWVTAAERQARNAGLPFGVVVVKHRRRGTGDGYVVMRLEQLTRLMQYIIDMESK